MMGWDGQIDTKCKVACLSTIRCSYEETLVLSTNKYHIVIVAITYSRQHHPSTNSVKPRRLIQI